MDLGANTTVAAADFAVQIVTFFPLFILGIMVLSVIASFTKVLSSNDKEITEDEIEDSEDEIDSREEELARDDFEDSEIGIGGYVESELPSISLNRKVYEHVGGQATAPAKTLIIPNKAKSGFGR
jgi:hypothetical protein